MQSDIFKQMKDRGRGKETSFLFYAFPTTAVTVSAMLKTTSVNIKYEIASHLSKLVPYQYHLIKGVNPTIDFGISLSKHRAPSEGKFFDIGKTMECWNENYTKFKHWNSGLKQKNFPNTTCPSKMPHLHSRTRCDREKQKL